MSAFAALLRGVNVGGKNPVKMADLARLCESLGFTRVKTLLQSGNVVFEAARKPKPAELEAAITKRFGCKTFVVLRTGAELQQTLAANPFPAAARDNPSHLIIVFFEKKPAAGAAKALEAWDKGPEKVKLVGDELFIDYGEGMGRTRLGPPVIDKQAGARGTARNFNTVTRLLALMKP